jgi:HAE1 family hydrophobic/amphiphilic exporter-1
MKLTEIALRRPVSVVILVAGLAVFSVLSALGMSLQYMPDMDMPMLIVSTVYPGAGPEDVEALVSREIEGVANLLNAVSTIQSQSSENMSLVIIQYEFGTDIDKAYFDLREGLDSVLSSLPEGAMEPSVIEMNINQQDSMTFSLSSEEGVDLLDYVNTEVIPALERESEIATVDVSGGRNAYVSVELDSAKLARYGLSMQQVASVVGAANFTAPVGTVRFGSQQVSVGASVEYGTLERLRSIPIPTPAGGLVSLSDVADVHDAFEEPESLSHYNGAENVSVGVKKRQSATDVSVCGAARSIIESLDTEKAGVHVETEYDASIQVMDSLKSILQTLLLAIALSMATLFLFTGDWKASLIVGSSIPVSLVLTLIMMSFMGYSLNMLTMSALIIGVGMMVDNSIVVLESCFVTYSPGLGYAETARKGAKDVTMSVIASTLTTVVVFLPLALVGGFVSVMFGQVAFTIVFSLLASLVSAITIVPLCYSLYRPAEKESLRFGRWLDRILEKYGEALRKIMYRKKSAALISVALLALALVLFSSMGMEMFPMVDGGQLALSIDTRPGLALEKRSEIYAKLEAIASGDPDVESYSLSAGGDSMAGGSSSSASLSITLKADRKKSTAEAVDYFQQEAEKIPDCSVTAEMVSSLFSSAMSSGMSTGVDVTLEGSDLGDLHTAANMVGDYLRSVEGVQRVSSSAFNRTSRVSVEIDPILSSAKGILPAQAAGALYQALGGVDTIEVARNGVAQTVTVEYPKSAVDDLGELSSLGVPSPTGALVPLSDIAQLRFTDTEQTISRANGKYQIAVSGQTMSYDALRISSAANKAIAGMAFPEGVAQASSFEDTLRDSEFNRLYYAIAQAILLVFMVMAIEFESARYSAMVMVSIPFSLIGSALLIFLTTGKMNMASLMGVLLLVGTVVNNGILYVDTVNLYRKQGMGLEDALVESGKRRARPILMTTLTTILSMLPIGLGLGSSEQMQGMALVVIGGLMASTLLTLILMPTFYIIIAKKEKEEAAS